MRVPHRNLQVNNESVEFMTRVKFSKLVDNLVAESRVSYMDAVLHLCEKYLIEPEDAKKYVSKVIKGKIEVEAMNLNYLKGNNESSLF